MEHGPDVPVNILLVDDQPSNLLSLEAILGDLGQNLVRATSGGEALDRLLHDDFAVVLLDVQMHGLDGFETANLIRSRGRSRHTPIIFLTAYDDPNFPAAKAYTLGAVDYLTKPLHPDILRAKVAVFVDLFQKTQQVRRQGEQLRRLERGQFEQRLAEENARLRESEGRFRTLADSAPVLIWLNGPGGCEFVNRPYLDLLGRTLEQVRGMGWVESVHPEDRPGYVDSYRRAWQAGRRFEAPVRLRRADGEYRWFLSVGLPRFARDGTLAGYVGCSLDVTERERAESALRESEARKAAVLETALDCIITIDHEGRVVEFNPAAERTFGYRREDVLGREMGDLIVPPSLRQSHREGLARYLATGEGPVLNRRLELTGLRADGSEFPVELAVTRITADGPPMFTGYVRDITERKRLEQELRHRAEQLAEADRRKDAWIAMLAHELRGPLSPVRTAVEVLRLKAPPMPELEQARDIIARQARHMAQIVDDLLDVTRIASGKILLRKERLDLGRLVRTTADDYRRTLGQAGLGLTVELPETPVWASGDATRLNQVLSNLLDNAAKFTGGGGQVTVRLTADEGQKRALLSVRDTGVGIEPGMLPRLFEPFSQADKSLHRTQGGLGLGLALVRGLAELHGGGVEARSEGPGRGAEFLVTLPLEGEPAALAETPAAPRPAGRRLRILVIEDNRDAADSLKVLLELLGHEVRVAYSGPAGVAAAHTWVPSLVISDIGLPGLDGFGVARELRASPATARVPLIALTGYGSDDDRRRAEEAGYSHVLKKPADPEALQELLASAP